MNKKNVRDFIIHAMVHLSGYDYETIKMDIFPELADDLKIVSKVGLLTNIEAEETERFIVAQVHDPNFQQLSISGELRFKYPDDVDYNEIAERVEKVVIKRTEEAKNEL